MTGQYKAPLQHAASLKARLDELSLPAHGLWSALHFYSINGDGTGMIPKAKLVSAAARRATEAKLLPLVAEIEAEGLLVDHGDSWELTPWENPDAETWNDPIKREHWRRAKQLGRDEKLCNAIRARDRNLCRYCGIEVSWTNKNPKSRHMATWEHINPMGDNSLDNVCVACKNCNSAKGARALSIARMVLWMPGTTKAMIDDGTAVPMIDHRSTGRSTAGQPLGQPGGQPPVDPSLVRARDSGQGRPVVNRRSTALAVVPSFDPDEDPTDSERVQALDALMREAQ